LIPEQLPQLRLDLPALEHNIRLMARWCRDQGVELCPHIKTTMTRPIVERQLDAGAWGATVATCRQAGIALDWGVRRILIANELVHAADLALLRDWLAEFPDLELYALVDSEAGLAWTSAALEGTANPLRLLLDVGAPGGRTGVPVPEAALRLGEAVQAAPGVLLAGVAGYEGIRPNVREEAVLAEVDAHCRRTVAVFRGLAYLFQTGQPVFSMGGSAFPDRVVAALPGPGGLPDELRPVYVLRSGCYVTHDHGTYAQVSPLPGLRPALSVRAVVISAPEPGRAVVGAGRRELPYDAGLPVLLGAQDAQGRPRAGARATADRIFDHHLVLTEVRGLEVGDVVDLGISHPCSAFDRWPEITVVDAGGRTGEQWHPQFH
jgi:D-serine deaminase-like pyridoxal phosphate-dependent protein